MQSGESGDTPILRDQENYSFYHILKFIKPDWYIISIGVFLYGIIGAGYPIFGALMAYVSTVRLVHVCLCYTYSILQCVFQVLSESNKDTILQLSQRGSLALIALALAVGFCYFFGVNFEIIHICHIRLLVKTMFAVLCCDSQW